MKMPDEKKFPVLSRLLERGIVRLEWTGEPVDGNPGTWPEVLGTASDGVEVSIGGTLNKYSEFSKVESYLSEHPTPETW